MGGRKTRAVTLMLLSSLSFSIMQVFVKMSSTEVGTFEQVFFRNLISMIIAGITVYRAKLCGAGPFLAFWASCWSFTPLAMPGRRMWRC